MKFVVLFLFVGSSCGQGGRSVCKDCESLATFTTADVIAFESSEADSTIEAPTDSTIEAPTDTTTGTPTDNTTDSTTEAPTDPDDSNVEDTADQPSASVEASADKTITPHTIPGDPPSGEPTFPPTPESETPPPILTEEGEPLNTDEKRERCEADNPHENFVFIGLASDIKLPLFEDGDIPDGELAPILVFENGCAYLQRKDWIDFSQWN